jgi:hypothetical protein
MIFDPGLIGQLVGTKNIKDSLEESLLMPARLVGQGTHLVRIRHENFRLVLQRLRRVGKASRAGLVRTTGKRHDDQPASMLGLDPRGACVPGVQPFGRASLNALVRHLRFRGIAGCSLEELLGSFGTMAGVLGAATVPLFLNFGPGASRRDGYPRDSTGGAHAPVA